MNLLYHNDHNHIKCHTQTPVIISATPLLYRKAEIIVISLHGKAKLSSRLTVSKYEFHPILLGELFEKSTTMNEPVIRHFNALSLT